MSANPYWVRLRGTGDEQEWDGGRRFGGADEEKGIEVLAASWNGAIITRLQKKNGTIWAKVYIIPWGRKGEPKRGITATIYDGPIDGMPMQAELI